MTVDLEPYEKALTSQNPETQLRNVVIRQMQENGVEREKMLEILERVRMEARLDFAYAEDLILDVMDFLAGWCSPHVKIP